MYIYYDENLKVNAVSSSLMEGSYIELTKKEYRKIEDELVSKFESFRVNIEENTVSFDEELHKEYYQNKREQELELNSKEVEISRLMIENEIIKRHLNIPLTLDLKALWEKRIENNYVSDEQIETLKELNII